MKYDPIDVDVPVLLKEGEGTFKILTADDNKPSKAGNPMVTIRLEIWDIDGKSTFVTDYLVSSLQFKIKHLYDAIGQPNLYKSGDIDPAFLVGKSGKCILKVEHQPGYDPQTKIKDYKKKEVSDSAEPEVSDSSDPFDDDIPI